MEKIVFIDDFGDLGNECNAKYKVFLNGSYSWCYLSKCWRYEVKETTPKIPLTYILSEEKIKF